MTQQQTADALAAVLLAHRDQLIEMLVDQAPAAGSGYAEAPPEQLRPRMSMVLDACIASIAQAQPGILISFMEMTAERRLREGYTIDSLITLALITEGALTDTAEMAFEDAPEQRAEAQAQIRTLIAAAEQALAGMAG